MIDIHHPGQYRSQKIVSVTDLIDRIGKKKIGLCHGGFDLTHPGHVRHFESAKKMSDVLVVSVTSDQFVSERKGRGRPIYPEYVRAYMIASLSCVDYVVITDAQSGVEVINLLKPSVYFKGPDYIGKQTPGIQAEREAIQKVGGEIKYTDDETLSTTSIIEYIWNNVNRRKLLVCIDRDGTLIEKVEWLGSEKNWREQLRYNNDLISFLSFLKTKYDCTFIVVSNQAGVARGLFDMTTVGQINCTIDGELRKQGIEILSWEFCPFVDARYAAAHPEIHFENKFVQETTRRKPRIGMVDDALRKLGKNLSDFDSLLVLGDREDDDKQFAKHLGASYIDVKQKSYEELKNNVHLH